MWAILGGLTLPFSLSFALYLLLSKLYATREVIPEEGYFPVGLISILLFWTIYLFVYYAKIIFISDNKVKIIFPLRLKCYCYDISEIEQHKIYYNKGRYKDFETIYFQTTDKKTYTIMQYEYMNYIKIKAFIEKESSFGEVEKYYNWKRVGISCITSIIFAIGLITIYNLLIINGC